MSRKEGQRKVQNRTKFRDIPAWARDDLVLRFLDSHGLRIRVVCDQRYMNGLSDKPLIVIRRKQFRGDKHSLDG